MERPVLASWVMQVDGLRTWARVQAAAWLPALGLLGWRPEFLTPTAWVAGLQVAIGGSFVALLVVLRAWRTAADGLTVLRVAGLVVLLGLHATDPGWPTWAGLLSCVLLDLVDGVAARRFGGSPAGAVLDMEADQLTVVSLSGLVVLGGGGVHVLVLPALRYTFVLVAEWWQIPANEPRPVNGDNRRGRTICAMIMVALLAALCPLVPRSIGDAATAVAVVLLLWSFVADARFLLAHRRGASA